MIVDERFVTYINSLAEINPDYLEALEKKALEEGVPIIRKDMQSLIKALLALKRPKRILEVGAAVGFSALLMREFSDSDCQITTIENYEKRFTEAKANFEKYDTDNRITLYCDDAQVVLKDLDEPYDIIFMDAAKGQYMNFFSDVMRLLPRGGLLISDNVLQDGDLIESRFAVTRRNRTIHKRMREYLYEITHNEELTTSILTIGDGAALSVKK